MLDTPEKVPIMDLGDDTLKNLRAIPTFVDYAQSRMAADADFWRREAAHDTGIMGTFAAAIVAIGGEP